MGEYKYRGIQYKEGDIVLFDIMKNSDGTIAECSLGLLSRIDTNNMSCMIQEMNFQYPIERIRQLDHDVRHGLIHKPKWGEAMYDFMIKNCYEMNALKTALKKEEK